MIYLKELKNVASKAKNQWFNKKLIWGLFIALNIVNFSCSSSDEEEFVVLHPILKVVNQSRGSSNRTTITAVSLVGYNFNSLSIGQNDSQTFILDNGMPGGYEAININVLLSGVNRSIKVNFKEGETTTVTMQGCIGFKGCEGFYIEHTP